MKDDDDFFLETPFIFRCHVFSYVTRHVPLQGDPLMYQIWSGLWSYCSISFSINVRISAIHVRVWGFFHFCFNFEIWFRL
jgi:hypothetical protein